MLTIILKELSYRKVMLLCVITLVALNSHAQTLGLFDAVTRSIDNYPLIQQRSAELAASKAHINTVTGYKLPTLKVLEEINAGTANSLPGGYFPLSTIPSVSGSIGPEQKTNLGSGNIALSYLDWPIYTFGYNNAQKKNAEAAFSSMQSSLNGDKYLLTENIISLYLDWVKKYKLLQIENENLERSQTIFNAIRATVLSGLKPGVDSSTANAEFAKSRIAYLQAQSNYMNDLIALATYTGLNTDKILPDTNILVHATEVAAVLPSVTDSVVSANPLIDIYQKQYEQQLSTNRMLSKMYLPKISLEGAGWVRGSSISPTNVYNTDLSNGLSYTRYNYLFGLTFSYNISDIKHQHDQIVEGRYYAKAKQEALQNQQLNLNRALQQANYAYKSTIEKLREYPLQLKSAQEAYDQQAALYRSGLNTLIDVTNAQYMLKQTETDYILSQGDLLQLLYIRAGFSNQLDTFLQTFKK